MAIILSSFSKDTYIAPEVSSFVSADIPDMSDYHIQQRHWVSNFFLNSMLRAKIEPKYRAYLFNYFRRCQAAFHEHDLARRTTLDFLGGSGQSPSEYSFALFHWETFLGQSWHGFKILEMAFDFKLFRKNDGSIEQRLNALYNQMKHVESRIDNGQILENATVPVWMTNEGLKSIDTDIEWDETKEVLVDLAKWAEILVDPLTTKEKLEELDA